MWALSMKREIDRMGSKVPLCLVGRNVPNCELFSGRPRSRLNRRTPFHLVLRMIRPKKFLTLSGTKGLGLRHKLTQFIYQSARCLCKFHIGLSSGVGATAP